MESFYDEHSSRKQHCNNFNDSRTAGHGGDRLLPDPTHCADLFLRPDLDPSWHTISEWAIGQHGWIMSGAFLISALSYAGIARLHWYCEPLRHPKRPGLTLARCPLIAEAITAGASHVAAGPFCLHAVAITPAGLMELIRSYFSINVGLPQLHGGSAPALIVSRPAQRSLTVENPGYGIGLLGTALRNSTR